MFFVVLFFLNFLKVFDFSHCTNGNVVTGLQEVLLLELTVLWQCMQLCSARAKSSILDFRLCRTCAQRMESQNTYFEILTKKKEKVTQNVTNNRKDMGRFRSLTGLLG